MNGDCVQEVSNNLCHSKKVEHYFEIVKKLVQNNNLQMKKQNECCMQICWLCQLGVFFLKCTNFRPLSFYNWCMKVRKQNYCFIHLPNMYMISNWKTFTIRQIWFANLSDNILNVFGSNLILSSVWPRTLCVRSMLLSSIFCFGLDMILQHFNTSISQLNRSQNLQTARLARP